MLVYGDILGDLCTNFEGKSETQNFLVDNGIIEIIFFENDEIYANLC